MPKLVLANTATAAYRRVYFDLRQSDGLTPATGEAAGQPQISTNGAAWTNTGIGTLSAIGNGRYYADLTQTAVLTAGSMIETRYKSASTIECPGDSVHVVAFDPHDSVRMGITALPNAAATSSGGLPTIGTGSNQLNLDGSGNVSADVREWVGTTPSALVSGRVDTTVGAMQAAVVTATAIASDAITAAKLASDVGTEIRSIVSGTADSGTTTSFVDAARVEADTDYWVGCLVMFTSGNIAGQTRLIAAFNAATDTISFSPATTQAVGTNTYEILPAGRVDLALVAGSSIATHIAAVADGVWDEARAGHVTAGTFGDGVASVTGNVGGNVGGNVTGNVGGNVTGSVGSLAAQAKSDVNAEVVDVLFTDTIAQLAQGQPSATPTVANALMLLYMALRNAGTTTATTLTIANSAGTVICKATLSDDTTTFTKAILVTGP